VALLFKHVYNGRKGPTSSRNPIKNNNNLKKKKKKQLEWGAMT